MRCRLLHKLPILLLVLVAGAPLGAQQILEHGVLQSGELVFGRSGRETQEFSVKVPANAIALTVSLRNAPADLDLIISSEDGEIIAIGETYQFNEVLTLNRLGHPALPTGTLIVEVFYQYSEPPLVDGVTSTRIPFDVVADVVELEVADYLEPGVPVSGVLEPLSGMARAYAIDVPAAEDVLRFDLFGAAGDLDLFVFYESLRGELRSADSIAQSSLSNETLIIGGDSGRPLLPGRWYVVVVDQVVQRFQDSFELHSRFDSAPPDQLLTVPNLEIPRTGLAAAMAATVEIVTDDGGGSAVFVSPDGHLITNRHVIATTLDRGQESVVIAVTRNRGVPPQETLRAIIIDTDEVRDLALLRVETGLYGQPLPDEYEFPYLEPFRADSLTYAEPLWFVGYSSHGGRGSRASVTVSSGIVSGFEAVPEGLVIKTDAVIGPGNSGGAAVDSEYRLIGFPTEVVGLGSAGVAYVYTTNMIPSHWWPIIGIDALRTRQ